VRADKTKEGVAIWQYMLHYLKWDKKWDEWVPEDGIYLDDPAGHAKKVCIHMYLHANKVVHACTCMISLAMLIRLYSLSLTHIRTHAHMHIQCH
jgi:hypothetical protein